MPINTANDERHWIALRAFRPDPSEMLGEQHSGDQHAEAHRGPFQNHFGTLGRKEPENGEAHRQIGKSPEHVDHWRRFADPRRRCERGLKPMAANALDKVRDAVGKKQSANELCEVYVPGHLGSLS